MRKLTLATTAALALGAARCSPREQAAGRSPAHQTSVDAHAGVPTFVWTTPKAKGEEHFSSIVAAARAHLGANAEAYRLRPNDLDELKLRDVHDIGHGPIVARFERQVDGIEVFNEVVSVTLNRKKEPVSFSGFVTGDKPKSERQVGRARFSLAPQAAVAVAVADAIGEPVNETAVSVHQASGGYEVGDLQGAPARWKKVWFRDANKQLVDAYYLEVDLGHDAEGAPRYYSYVIAASDRRVLFKNDLSSYDRPITYRVWSDPMPLPIPKDSPFGNGATPLPGALPNGYQHAFEGSNLVTASSLFGVNDDWLAAGVGETIGNNVEAYVDISGNDGFDASDFHAELSGAEVFDYTYLLNQAPDSSPSQYRAGITQLFFNNNFWHDWYYVAGFDEASGNAQANNYGRGGVEGDSIRAEGQDSSGVNNANMSTPADGGRPRMQMFLWDFSQASISISSPSTTQYRNVGRPNGWGGTNYDLPTNSPIVRSVPADGCSALTGDYTGQIVLIDRGTCGFSVKAGNAQVANAAGVIIANVASSNNPTVAPGMALTAGQSPPSVPSLSLNLDDGNEIRALIAGGPTTGFMSSQVTKRNGDLDNQIMAHEWGHYISNRLVFNSNGLSTNMARGLGEGWADMHALLMTVRPGDDLEPSNSTFNGVYAMASYAAGSLSRDNAFYFGIRRYPYSTDLTKNALTFRHIADGQALPAVAANLNSSPNSEVHNAGEVWTTMLWECYAALLRDTQGSTPRLTFDEARDRFRDYMVAAYKITPAAPTLLEARDALLAAAYAEDLADYQAFWAAFAKRGAGLFAVAPDRYSTTNTPVVESYGVGPALRAESVVVVDDVASVCTADGLLDEGETGTATITFRNIGSAASAPTQATVSTNTAGISFPSGATVEIPATDPFEVVTATIRVAASGLASGPVTIDLQVAVPDLGGGAPPVASLSFAGNYDEIPANSSTDSVESAATVWQVERTAGLIDSDVWRRAATTPVSHRWNGPSAAREGASNLVSPDVVARLDAPLVLSISHRHSFELGGYDGGVIELSNDAGQSWTDIGSGYNGTVVDGGDNPLSLRRAFVNQSDGYPAYFPLVINLGTTYAGQTVRFRFRVGSDVGVGSIGWDIDNIALSGITSLPFGEVVSQGGCNLPPTANAGATQSVGEFGAAPVYAATTVALNSSASTDPESSPLTYDWVQTGGPLVTLSSASAANPTFTAPTVSRAQAQVNVSFRLIVRDALGRASAPATTSVTVTEVNRVPVASASAPASANEGATVSLDASGSSDADVDNTLEYSWVQTAGPVLTVANANTSLATFTVPAIVLSTSASFQLTVSDGVATDTRVVTVGLVADNDRPTADAGGPQDIPERGSAPDYLSTVVSLTGVGGDVNNDILTYAWTQTAGPTVVLTGANTASPTFVAPSIARGAPVVLTFQLTVSDGLLSATSTTSVTVNDTNRPPVASAGSPSSFVERAAGSLDGSASSDPDSDNVLTYAWVQTAGPTVTLSDTAVASPTFTAPEVSSDTSVSFELTVSDGLLSTQALVSHVIVQQNRAPVANAGRAQSVAEGTLVVLNGSGSDEDGDSPLAFEWTAPEGIVLSDVHAAQPSFVAPQVNAMTAYTFSLVVTDPSLQDSIASSVVVTVRNVLPPTATTPTANAGADQIVNAGDEVVLDGSQSRDGKVGALSYDWSLVDGAGLKLASTNTVRVKFSAPEVEADTALTFQLVVSNAEGVRSEPDLVTVLVKGQAPVRQQTPPQTSALSCSHLGSSEGVGDATLIGASLLGVWLSSRRRARRS